MLVASVNLGAPVALRASSVVHPTREGRDRVVQAARAPEVRVVRRVGLVEQTVLG